MFSRRSLILFNHLCCEFLSRNCIATWRAELIATKIYAVSLSSPWRLLPGSTAVTAPLRIREDGFSPHAEELSARIVILR